MGAALTDRTRVRRLPHHQVDDRAALDAVLDAGRVAHVGVIADGVPLVVPFAYARDGDLILVHGSTGSRAVRWLATGAPTSLTISLLDGYVLARAAVEVSMRYRSAILMGTFTRVDEPGEALAGLRAVSEHSVPGRWDDLRPPTRKELASTAVLTMAITEWSLKVNDGWPTDSDEDRARRVWAGVVPVTATLGTPRPDPYLPSDVSAPVYLSEMPVPGAHT